MPSYNVSNATSSFRKSSPYFVGIPLPGTGAWTGCLIAALLGMVKKKSFLFTTLGVLMAGIIMLILSFGVLGNIIR